MVLKRIIILDQFQIYSVIRTLLKLPYKQSRVYFHAGRNRQNSNYIQKRVCICISKIGCEKNKIKMSRTNEKCERVFAYLLCWSAEHAYDPTTYHYSAHVLRTVHEHRIHMHACMFVLMTRASIVNSHIAHHHACVLVYVVRCWRVLRCVGMQHGWIVCGVSVFCRAACKFSGCPNSRAGCVTSFCRRVQDLLVLLLTRSQDSLSPFLSLSVSVPLIHISWPFQRNGLYKFIRP